MTQAHVFAKSWTVLFDDPDSPLEHEVVHRRTDPETGATRETKRSKTLGLVSRNVCGRCNSGWLRELEDRVRPLMAAFAAGSPVTLDRTQQADLALWATCASLIAMEMDPSAAGFASPDLAHAIYHDRRLPPGVQVWLGANTHGEMAWFGSYSLSFPRDPQSGGWGATPCLGYAVMQVIYHGRPDQRLRLRGDVLRTLRRLDGALATVRWPPRLRLARRDLSPLAYMLAEQSSFERAARAGR